MLQANGITITLSEQEALALRAVLACVAGGKYSARQYTDSVRDVLDDAGFTYTDTLTEHYCTDGRIEFL